MTNFDTAWLSVTDADLREGERAYERYNHTMLGFALHYGLPLTNVVAAFVALSPQNDYHGNVRSLASVLHGFVNGTPVHEITVSTYNHCRDRAFNYLAGEPFDTPDRGMKIRSFYHNILDPSDERWVTIDGHMVCLFFGYNKPMTEAKVRNRTEYALMQGELNRLAFQHFLVPCQMQATLWFMRKRVTGIRYDAQLNLFQDQTDSQRALLDPAIIQPYPTREPA